MNNIDINLSYEEKIEDEIDMEVIEEYEEKVKNGSIKTYGHEEIKRILEI